MNLYAALEIQGEHMNKSPFSIMTLQREACSSREAVYYHFKKYAQKRKNSLHLPITENPITHFPSGKQVQA